MAHSILSNVKILLGWFDLSGDSNSVKISKSVADLDNTTFGGTGTKARILGLPDCAVGMAGLMDLAADGQEYIQGLYFVTPDTPLFVGLSGGALGEPCQFGAVNHGSFELGGATGERAEWSANAMISSSPFVRGIVLAQGVKTTTFTGSAYLLGPVAAGQRVYVGLWNTYTIGVASMTIKLQSDDNGSFTSPTDRATFTGVDGISAEIKSADGPITDTYWRIVCSSFTGSGTRTIYAAIGIV